MTAIAMPEQKRRRELIDKVRANNALEELFPSKITRDIEERYVSGQLATIEDYALAMRTAAMTLISNATGQIKLAFAIINSSDAAAVAVRVIGEQSTGDNLVEIEVPKDSRDLAEIESVVKKMLDKANDIISHTPLQALEAAHQSLPQDASGGAVSLVSQKLTESIDDLKSQQISLPQG